MSSGGNQVWFVFGELIAPPPPLLTPSAPATLAGLAEVVNLVRHQNPCPSDVALRLAQVKGEAGKDFHRRRQRQSPPEDMEPDAKPHRTGCPMQRIAPLIVVSIGRRL